MSIPAGWYPDPSQRFPHRYWDGQRWSDYAAGPQGTVVDPLPPAPQQTQEQAYGQVHGQEQQPHPPTDQGQQHWHGQQYGQGQQHAPYQPQGQGQPYGTQPQQAFQQGSPQAVGEATGAQQFAPAPVSKDDPDLPEATRVREPERHAPEQAAPIPAATAHEPSPSEPTPQAPAEPEPATQPDSAQEPTQPEQSTQPEPTPTQEPTPSAPTSPEPTAPEPGSESAQASPDPLAARQAAFEAVNYSLIRVDHGEIVQMQYVTEDRRLLVDALEEQKEQLDVDAASVSELTRAARTTTMRAVDAAGNVIARIVHVKPWKSDFTITDAQGVPLITGEQENVIGDPRFTFTDAASGQPIATIRGNSSKAEYFDIEAADGTVVARLTKVGSYDTYQNYHEARKGMPIKSVGQWLFEKAHDAVVDFERDQLRFMMHRPQPVQSEPLALVTLFSPMLMELSFSVL